MCSFHFGGKTQSIGPPGKRHKRRTYTDTGYVNKGPTVCTSFSIDAERLETALMAEIERRLARSVARVGLETMIDDYLSSKQSCPHNDIERVQTDLLRLDNQISSLITLAEKGIKLEEIAERIRKYEFEQSVVREKLRSLTSPRPARDEITSVVFLR